MVNAITKNEYVLQQKLEAVTGIPLSVGPQGPTGPTGQAGFAEYGGYYSEGSLTPLVFNQNIALLYAAQANGAELLLPIGTYIISYSVSGNLSKPVELSDGGVPINATRMQSNQASTASNTIIYRITNANSPLGLYYVGNGFDPITEQPAILMYAIIIVLRVN